MLVCRRRGHRDRSSEAPAVLGHVEAGAGFVDALHRTHADSAQGPSERGEFRLEAAELAHDRPVPPEERVTRLELVRTRDRAEPHPTVRFRHRRPDTDREEVRTRLPHGLGGSEGRVHRERRSVRQAGRRLRGAGPVRGRIAVGQEHDHVRRQGLRVGERVLPVCVVRRRVVVLGLVPRLGPLPVHVGRERRDVRLVNGVEVLPVDLDRAGARIELDHSDLNRRVEQPLHESLGAVAHGRRRAACAPDRAGLVEDEHDLQGTIGGEAQRGVRGRCLDRDRRQGGVGRVGDLGAAAAGSREQVHPNRVGAGLLRQRNIHVLRVRRPAVGVRPRVGASSRSNAAAAQELPLRSQPRRRSDLEGDLDCHDTAGRRRRTNLTAVVGRVHERHARGRLPRLSCRNKRKSETTSSPRLLGSQ